ncbi:MAG: DNA polymerase IV [Planctomycetota bacterium]
MAHRDQRLPARTPRILHLDVDAFLASVESARDPRLRGKPLVIGASPRSRGLVMSCSYEARAFGVRAGMFSHEAARRCPQAIFRPGDSQAANAMRGRLAALLLDFTPIVEIASIDDFFLDLRGTTRLLGAAADVAHAIRARVRDELHLPVTIGIATGKTLARIAGKLGKPSGVAEILPGHEEAFLTHLPLEHLPGVGHSIRRSLADFALRTVGDLRQVSKEVLFASFGSHGLELYDRARGIDHDPVQATCRVGPDGLVVQKVPKTIHRDSSFEPEEGRWSHIEAMLAYLTDRAADRLRHHGLRAGSMEVRVLYVDTRSSRARERGSWESNQVRLRRRLPEPSAQTEALWQHARTLLQALPRRRALVKRVGLSLLQLREQGPYQHTLFSDPTSDRSTAELQAGRAASRSDRAQALDQALDRLRERHGFGSVQRGTAMPLRQDHELGRDGFGLRTPSLNQ